MKIIPRRTMTLDKKRVEQGKSVTVSDSEGKLAIRHGWAVEDKGGKADKSVVETDNKESKE
jgi:hypothetical protein